MLCFGAGMFGAAWYVSTTYFILQSVRRSEFGCENPIQGRISAVVTASNLQDFGLI